ncbi:YlbF family regulator [Ligilactobacillus ceti]|uniref:UPF0342 protein IV53_GL000472 n=1 Tax=Ligilactobacillus ceti DSM 22408 TaxID=1122146 RepID=A0A0R2KMX0_9LACO|nr:YlbF family regulator [Ligilactobacillus ceti]KRN88508.1 hypothetical protein IV53_GL000472 [Ligilactobacillus ceti DSM 22408]
MVNIFDTANQLAKEIKETPEFKDLQTAYAELKADEKAFESFNKLREIQAYLQKCQMEGNLEAIKEEEVAEMQKLSQEVQQFEAVLNLMAKERTLSVLMDDVAKTIFTPVTDLYES